MDLDRLPIKGQEQVDIVLRSPERLVGNPHAIEVVPASNAGHEIRLTEHVEPTAGERLGEARAPGLDALAGLAAYVDRHAVQGDADHLPFRSLFRSIRPRPIPS